MAIRKALVAATNGVVGVLEAARMVVVHADPHVGWTMLEALTTTHFRHVDLVVEVKSIANTRLFFIFSSVIPQYKLSGVEHSVVHLVSLCHMCTYMMTLCCVSNVVLLVYC
ncbi:hypothetical protein R6Q59_030138 [Mikania micrantha]